MLLQIVVFFSYLFISLDDFEILDLNLVCEQ